MVAVSFKNKYLENIKQKRSRKPRKIYLIDLLLSYLFMYKIKRSGYSPTCLRVQISVLACELRLGISPNLSEYNNPLQNSLGISRNLSEYNILYQLFKLIIDGDMVHASPCTCIHVQARLCTHLHARACTHVHVHACAFTYYINVNKFQTKT